MVAAELVFAATADEHGPSVDGLWLGACGTALMARSRSSSFAVMHGDPELL